MRMQYTNEPAPLPVTTTQVIFGYVVYGVATVGMMAITYAAIVFAFCL